MTLQLIYHHADVRFAGRLASDLALNGVDLWVDFFLPDAKRQALPTSNGYVIILSPNFDPVSVKDIHGEGLNVFPVVKTAIETWPKGVRRDLAIDFTGWGSQKRYQMHLNELMHILAFHTNSVKTPITDPILQHVYRLIGQCAIAGVGYIPFPIETEPLSIENDEPEIIVIRENDNLGEQIARQAEAVGEEIDEEDDLTSSSSTLVRLDSISALLAKRERFIIVGRDGVGKTVALQRLALEGVWQYNADPTVPVPLYLDLARWDNGVKFSKFVASQVSPEVAAMVDEGNVALYLDNLDGVDVRDWVGLARWVDSDEAPDILVMAVDVRRYNGEMMLPIVIIDTTLHNTTFSSPNSNQTNNFLSQLKFKLNTLPFEKLTKIATKLIDENTLYYFPREWAINQITEQKGLFGRRKDTTQENSIIDQLIEAEILEETNEHLLKFTHTLYRDYFAALALIDNGIGSTVKPPQFDDQRRLPTRWDQPLIFATQLLDDASQLISDIASKDPFLALGCVEAGASVDDNTRQILTQNMLHILQQNDWRQSLAAIAGLKRLDETVLVERMIEFIAYGDLYERRLATRVFGELRHAAGIPLLAEAMQDEALRSYAQESLINIGSSAVPDVAQLLDPDVAPRWETRMAAIGVLRAIQDTRTVPILVETLLDPSNEVAWAAADALGVLRKPAVMPLIQFIQEDRVANDPETLSAAAMAIIWTDDADGIVQLANLLDDPNPLRRAVIADTLGGASGMWLPLAVSKLAKCLDDDVVVELDGEMLSISDIAVRSLEEIGTPEALLIVKQHGKRST